MADGYVNRRVIVFDADTGAFKRMWGAYGRPRCIGHSGQFVFLHALAVDSSGNIYTAEVGGGRRAQKFVRRNSRS